MGNLLIGHLVYNSFIAVYVQEDLAIYIYITKSRYLKMDKTSWTYSIKSTIAILAILYRHRIT